MPFRDLLLAALVIIVWGVNFVVIKVGLVGVPPMLLGALRFLAAAFPAVLVVPRPRVAARWVVAYGLTIGLGQFALLFTAIHVGMPAGLASVVLQAQAFFTLLLAAVFLHERWRAWSVVGLLVATFGLALIGRAGTHGEVSLLGFVLTLCAAASWAAGNVVTKRMGQVDLLGLVVWGALVPPIPFLALSYWLEGPARIASALSGLGGRSFFAIAYLAYGATLVGYTLFGRLLARHPVARIAPMTLLVPVVGVASAALLLGERLSASQAIGAVLVLAGLAVNVFGPRLVARIAARGEGVRGSPRTEG